MDLSCILYMKEPSLPITEGGPGLGRGTVLNERGAGLPSWCACGLDSRNTSTGVPLLNLFDVVMWVRRVLGSKFSLSDSTRLLSSPRIAWASALSFMGARSSSSELSPVILERMFDLWSVDTACKTV